MAARVSSLPTFGPIRGMLRPVDILIDHDWRGAPARANEGVSIALSRASAHATSDLLVQIDAPFHNDKPPTSAAGPAPRLWNFEVVELFLLGGGLRYLELEFGPHGHWLALELEGVRNVVRSENSEQAVQFGAERSEKRWRGTARVDVSLLPAGLSRLNAYAIHGADLERRYLAAFASPGSSPDFHSLEYFRPFDWDALRVRRSP